MTSSKASLPLSLIGLVFYGILAIVAYYTLIVLYANSHNSFEAIYASSGLEPTRPPPPVRRWFASNPQRIRIDPLTEIIRPERRICGDVDSFLVVFVHSRAGNYANRALIRNTWGNPGNYPGTSMELVFFIGYPDFKLNGALMRDALQEMNHYQDTVLLPVLDTYKNVTKKALYALEFIASNCQRTPFVLKADDDVVVNLFSIISTLHLAQQGLLKPYPTAFRSPSPHSHATTLISNELLMCLVWPNAKPYRNETNKWYISREVYPNDTYPLTCSGSAWIMSMRVMCEIQVESKDAEEFPFDDVLITGFLPQKIGIRHLQIGHHYELQVDEVIAREEGPSRSLVADKVVFHTTDKNTFQALWLSVLSGPIVQIRPVRIP